jgi:chromosomal replication initiation ATPase DnaA
MFPKWYKRAPRHSIKAVMAAVADVSHVPVREIVGQDKHRHITHARFAIIWIMRQIRPDMSFPTIGHHMGARDQGTILHGYRRAVDMMETNADFAEMVKQAQVALR